MPTETIAIVFACLAALLTGFAKTGLPGIGIFVVVLMALAFPGETKQSVGALLPLLVVGDIMALIWYRRHAEWRKLLKLVPAVVIGMILAQFALGRIDEAVFRPLLGLLVLGMVLLELARRRFGLNRVPHHWAFVNGTGLLAGFSTTMGNVAGPIMGIYFLSRGWVKEQFMGTAAWFFFAVNVTKIPILWNLNLITKESLALNAKLCPLVILGGLVGVWLLPKIPAKAFAMIVLILSAVSAMKLVLG
jgi:uncharacterized protein